MALPILINIFGLSIYMFLAYHLIRWYRSEAETDRFAQKLKARFDVDFPTAGLVTVEVIEAMNELTLAAQEDTRLRLAMLDTIIDLASILREDPTITDEEHGLILMLCCKLRAWSEGTTSAD